MRIAIITDAWKPQVNGVVTTLSRVGECLEADGHEVFFLTPQAFSTVPCPTYPEIRLALATPSAFRRLIERFDPDAIHIATEGPLGHLARAYCRKRKLPFTSAYHTQFPEYLRLRAPLPLGVSYAYLRRFHGAAVRTLVPTESLQERLEERGFEHLVLWSRGVDTQLFRPRPKSFIDDRRPIAMYVGRVAVEKNLEAFLEADVPGSKYVVGAGPDLETLRARYPDVRFVGFKHGEELASHVAAADVFVFPSRTDTFGLTMLEAMACGVPVAAFPVTGPKDVVRQGETGVLDEDLRAAILNALELDPARCVAFAQERTWQACARQLLGHLAPFKGEHAAASVADAV